MTDPKDRQHQRAVRRYQRENPGVSLSEARAAIATRSGPQADLPALIVDCPRPAPAEPIAVYVRRVAGHLGCGVHRAMELLGLEPGNSASARLYELARGLDEPVLNRLRAATGLSGELTWLAIGGPRRTALPDLFPRIRPGGRDKTRTTSALAATLNQYGQRVALIDLDHQPQAAFWGRAEPSGGLSPDVLGSEGVDLRPALPELLTLDEACHPARGAEVVRGGAARRLSELMSDPAGPRPQHRRLPPESEQR
ncbi:hypothetical protein [Kitasatospora sp. MBT66]|uniref:hypothetical protein n=1 Tax=Kitasatospora sp. MBT66 TaxID=1444769 RepID=UPI0011EA6BBF|nr:hypothetical protein [Kitasatospora sp. MBT66]